MRNKLCLTFVTLLLALAAAWSALDSAAQSPANPGDVHINEVAWMGTAASYNDEWIELHNTSGAPITLTGWTLLASDGNPSVVLSGSIPAHGYFLLERTDDDAISDLPADQLYGGVLSNDGETLVLADPSGAQIDVANQDGAAWPAGDNIAKHTMERADLTVPDNWASNDGLTINGLDAGGAPLNGTPGARNSAYVTPPPPQPNLVIAKSGPLTATLHGVITYTIRLSNTGDLAASAVHVADTLPPSVQFLAQDSPFAFSQDGQALHWTVGDLPTATAPSLITLTGQVSATHWGETAWLPIVNVVTATTTTTETFSADNVARWTTSVVEPPAESANLSIHKSGPRAAAPGSVITYTIRLSNTGSLSAVHVADTLPPSVGFLAQDSPFGFNRDGQALHWTVGDLPTITAPLLITVAGRISAAVGSALWPIVNVVTATTTTPESTSADNVSRWTTIVAADGSDVYAVYLPLLLK